MIPTLPEVLEYIASNATQEDVERIFDAANGRQRMLRTVRAASITTGTNVRSVNMSPKALNDLVGEVQSIRGQRADVLLNADSTMRLAFSRCRFSAGAMAAHRDQRGHLLAGMPLTGLEVV